MTDIILKGSPDIMNIMAKIISERIPVEKIYHPFVCGPNNAIIRKLMEETGARIDLPPPGVLKDEIMVSGDKDGVYKCKATIIGIYQEKKLKCQTMSVQVKKFQHKYVVGPDGSYLQEILANTGVSVEVPLLESPSERITLRGEQEKLGLALKMVCSKANGVICAVVNAPEWLHKFIIGKKGENIRRITQDCPKVRVEFLQGKDKIQVEGPQNEVLHAASALQDNVNELESHMDFAEVEIEQQFHKHIIGKAGANIRKIRNETGVMIFIPKDADNSNIIRIEGDRKGVKRAKHRVMEIASRMEKNTKKEVIIDQRFHRIIFGAKGKTVQGIRGQFNQVQITFPDQGKKSDTVTLRGPKSDVDKCAVYLVKIAKELECQMVFAEIKIEQQFHKHIIGKTSTEIRRIINETGAMIHIPPHDEKNPIICIEGESKGVQRAKQQLMEMASRMEKKKTKCIIIDQRFHRIIFGAKGKTVQEIQGQFNQVQITFPDQGKRSNTVTLRGPKSNVDKCAVYLVKIAKELMVEETMTRVDLPSENSNSDMITKSYVEAADTKIEKSNNE